MPLSSALAALAIALLACSGVSSSPRAVSAYAAAPLSVEIPSGLSEEQVQQAMVATLERRRWTVVSEEPGEVRGQLDHQGIEGRVALRVEGERVVIVNESFKKGSTRRGRGYAAQARSRPAEDHPVVPTRWLRNLQKDLGAQLGRAR